mmetsp:Transcript_32190/g.86155  ORF Transcript_32190/g.86155 Transcript_32190/m.86155 type:complete len:214 (+) Transcript_32190:1395-2036(+)
MRGHCSEQGRAQYTPRTVHDPDAQGVQGRYRVVVARAAALRQGLPRHAAGKHALRRSRDPDQAAARKGAKPSGGQPRQGDQVDTGLDASLHQVPDPQRPALLRRGDLRAGPGCRGLRRASRQRHDLGAPGGSPGERQGHDGRHRGRKERGAPRENPGSALRGANGGLRQERRRWQGSKSRSLRDDVWRDAAAAAARRRPDDDADRQEVRGQVR